MRFFRKWPVRLALFLAGLFLINAGVEFLFLQIRAESAVVMHDLVRVDNIDIAFVGSSLSRRHVKNAVIEECLGQDSFNLSASAAWVSTDYAMMQELFKHHKVKTVVFVSDILTDVDLKNKTEAVVVEAGIRPLLHGWDIKLPYTLDNCRYYGNCLDRIFPWRTCYPTTLEGLQENFQGKLNEESYYNTVVCRFSGYDGKGYDPVYGHAETYQTELHNFTTRKVKKSASTDTSLLDTTLMKMQLLCKSNDCNLIVITTPQLPQVLLGDQRYSQYYEIERSLCEKYGIPFWNFAYAEDELLPDLTPYFYRNEHFDDEGAEIFSQALSRVLKEYFGGQDVSHYFMTARQYANSRNYILNGWYTQKAEGKMLTYTADCIYGANVKPEYQFTAVDENGGETVLQVYYSTTKCTVKKADMEGRTIQIRIRNAENLDQEPVLAVKR